jgi:hypothetical protein
VTPSELGTWLHVTFDNDDARAQAAIDAAWSLVCDAAGQTAEWDAPAVVVTITKVAAARAWTNPTGAQRQQQSTGPFASDLSWNPAGVMLTGDEREVLAALNPAQAGVPGLSSIRVVAPAHASASRVLAWGELQQFDGDDE